MAKSYFQMTPEEQEEYKRKVKERMSKHQDEPWVTVREPDGAMLTMPLSMYQAERERVKREAVAEARRKPKTLVEDGKTLDDLINALPTVELANEANKICVPNRIAGVPDGETWAQIKQALKLE